VGGRDQEDHSSKSAGANSLQDPIMKKPFTKKKKGGGGGGEELVEWLKVNSSPSTTEGKKILP
jgi:hypothetical protein